VPGYRLKSAIVGVERSAKGMLTARIASGSVLNLPDTEQTRGMVEVVYEHRYISVFIEDVCERGERVDRRNAGST
jgi:hypothetical protein